MLISILLATVVSTQFDDPSVAPESINRYCADYVGIPYASDNFTDEEWEQFKDCVKMKMMV